MALLSSGVRLPSCIRMSGIVESRRQAVYVFPQKVLRPRVQIETCVVIAEQS